MRDVCFEYIAIWILIMAVRNKNPLFNFPQKKIQRHCDWNTATIETNDMATW